MKKKINLDFTSLLDVILILLFIVLSTMSEKTSEKQEEAERSIAEAALLQEEYDALLGEKEALLGQAEALTAALQDSEAKALGLEQELALQKAAAGEEADPATLYRSLLENGMQLTIVCTTETVSGQSYQNQVSLAIYGAAGMGDQELLDTVIFPHDTRLNAYDRAKANAGMRSDLFHSLRELIGADVKLVLLTVEYNYRDKNLSQTDLDIIAAAVAEVERAKNLNCFINKVKK